MIIIMESTLMMLNREEQQTVLSNALKLKQIEKGIKYILMRN